jgi:hypothetical protein
MGLVRAKSELGADFTSFFLPRNDIAPLPQLANGLGAKLIALHNATLEQQLPSPDGLLSAAVYFAMRTMPSMSGCPGLFEDPSTPLLATICGRKSRLGTSIDRLRFCPN